MNDETLGDYVEFPADWDDLERKEKKVLSVLGKPKTVYEIKEALAVEDIPMYSLRRTIDTLLIKGKIYELPRRDGKKKIYGRTWSQKVINHKGIITTEIPKIAVIYGEETLTPIEVVLAAMSSSSSPQNMVNELIHTLAELWLISYHKQTDTPITTFDPVDTRELHRKLVFWATKARYWADFCETIAKMPIWDNDAVGTYVRLTPIGEDYVELSWKLDAFILARKQKLNFSKEDS